MLPNRLHFQIPQNFQRDGKLGLPNVDKESSNEQE